MWTYWAGPGPGLARTGTGSSLRAGGSEKLISRRGALPLHLLVYSPMNSYSNLLCGAGAGPESTVASSSISRATLRLLLLWRTAISNLVQILHCYHRILHRTLPHRIYHSAEAALRHSLLAALRSFHFETGPYYPRGVRCREVGFRHCYCSRKDRLRGPQRTDLQRGWILRIRREHCDSSRHRLSCLGISSF